MTHSDSAPNAPPESDGAESPALHGPPAVEAEAGAPPPSANLEEDLPSPPTDADLRRLRELLFSREIVLIDKLRAFHDDPATAARKIGDVLAEAIHLRSSARDPRLAMALEPVVDGIVKKSLHTRRGEFVNALSPLMGPTIRKSIAEGFQTMMGSFGKSVEMAFSWKGLRWRFEALRSGRPFSEVVMLHTLVYRVEQLFFIHNDTGLVLAHVSDESVESQDADMVSAMLTAIRDFVRDCFAGGRDEALHSLEMGEFTLHIESGPQAYLACVLRGTPPPTLHSELRATLELMHIEYGDALAAFNGDNEPFAGAARHLESRLASQYADEKEIPLLAKILPALLLLALVAGLGRLYQTRVRARAEQARIASETASLQAKIADEREEFARMMRTALGYLRSEPGLVIVDATESPTAPWEIIVLKDALGRHPSDVLREKGLNPALFSTRVIPFVSYDPSIVVRRVRKSIQPPATVKMVFDERGTLTFTGTAPMSWIVAVREDARAIPGVERVDVSGVHDPMMGRINSMIAAVENTVIEFPLGRDVPLPSDMPKLQKAIDTLVELENITKSMGFTASLTIFGHADAVGDDRRNYEISQARARTVAGMLYARGSAMPVAIYGMGAEYPRGDQSAARRESQASRRIELRVHFALSPSASPEMFGR